MSNRDARPLSEKGMSALHDAALEEIQQGYERWGLPVLLGLHTGARRRLITHWTDKWETIEDGERVVQTPRRTECKITEGGCRNCHSEDRKGPDGVLSPKTATSEQRTIPIFDSWYDFHEGKERDTKLPSWLDHWFKTHDAGWGFGAHRLSQVIKRVATRRHDVISTTHQGEETVTINCVERNVPDITFHDLRATWCTQCIRLPEIDETTIMDWGGWKSRQMIDHYRGFVGDPNGSARDAYEGGPDSVDGGSNDDNKDVDMGEVMEVYNRITDGESLDGKQYSSDVLSAAYEMVQAS